MWKNVNDEKTDNLSPEIKNQFKRIFVSILASLKWCKLRDIWETGV
jgi:hypothetical protein